MNCKSLCASLAVAFVLGNVTVRQARADLTQEQLQALAQDYVSLLYRLDSLGRQLDDKNAQISRWTHSIDAMESSALGLAVMLLYSYPPLTDAERESINAHLNVLYTQILHAKLELDLYKSQRDSLKAEISRVQAAMALIEEILAGY